MMILRHVLSHSRSLQINKYGIVQPNASNTTKCTNFWSIPASLKDVLVLFKVTFCVIFAFSPGMALGTGMVVLVIVHYHYFSNLTKLSINFWHECTCQDLSKIPCIFFLFFFTFNCSFLSRVSFKCIMFIN